MIYGIHPKQKQNDSYYRRFADLAEYVADATRTLTLHTDDFDCIIVTGVSGLVVGSPVALALSKELLVLRKDSEHCHGCSGELIGAKALETSPRVLFLDDLISTRTTYRRCESAVTNHDRGGEIVAQYLYVDDKYVALS